jgi:hypothetical protein
MELSNRISFAFFRKLPSKRRPRLYEDDFNELIEWLRNLAKRNIVPTEQELWDKYKVKVATLRKYCDRYRPDLMVRQRTYPHKGTVYFGVIPRSSSRDRVRQS